MCLICIKRYFSHFSKICCHIKLFFQCNEIILVKLIIQALLSPTTLSYFVHAVFWIKYIYCPSSMKCHIHVTPYPVFQVADLLFFSMFSLAITSLDNSKIPVPFDVAHSREKLKGSTWFKRALEISVVIIYQLLVSFFTNNVISNLICLFLMTWQQLLTFSFTFTFNLKFK